MISKEIMLNYYCKGLTIIDVNHVWCSNVHKTMVLLKSFSYLKEIKCL